MNHKITLLLAVSMFALAACNSPEADDAAAEARAAGDHAAASEVGS